MIKDNNKGFSLIEVIIVFSIIAILAAIAVPYFNSYIEKSKQVVCDVNCAQLERMYSAFLTLENKEHSEIIFREYRKTYKEFMCPNNGTLEYRNNGVECRVHSGNKDSDNGNEDDDDDVPYL